MKLGYMRVSTTAQVTDAQEADLLAAGVAKANIYADKLSGKSTKRPALQECLKALREGDTLVITRLSRLARSVGDLLAIIDGLEARGIGLEVIHQPELASNSPTGKFLRTVLSAVDQLQREIIVENTREGLAVARAQGRTGGRKPKVHNGQEQAIRTMRAEGMNVSEIAKSLKVSRATVYRHLGEASKP